MESEKFLIFSHPRAPFQGAAERSEAGGCIKFAISSLIGKIADSIQPPASYGVNN